MSQFFEHVVHRRFSTVPGLIRVDRAMLYIRQQLEELIRTIERRDTKTVGEPIYTLRSLVRQMGQLCSMSGHETLAEKLFNLVGPLSTRTPRKEALDALRTFLKELETYQGSSDVEDIDALRERIDMLEHQLFDPGEEEKTMPVDTSKESTVFVIMPFKPEFNDVWKGGIIRAAKTENFTPIRVDMINRSTNITDDIVGSIEKCRLAIVDVTGNNPNVMFELGYAMAKSKPNIIISQSVDFLPFDIRNIRTIVYSNTWSGIEELRLKIQEFLHEYSAIKRHSGKKIGKGALPKESTVS